MRNRFEVQRRLFTVCLFLVAAAAASLTVLAAESAKGTLENLKAMHATQSAAVARYTAFAAKADEEGYKSVSALFRAAARSKAVHLAAYEKAVKDMGGEVKKTGAKPEVKSTRDNVEAALKLENAELDAVYPAFILQAEKDGKAAGKAKIFLSGDKASAVELVKHLKAAQGNLDGWKAAGKTFLVCTVCSYITDDMALKQCPVCASPRDKFETFK